MSCGIETLVIALQLARVLVVDPNPSQCIENCGSMWGTSNMMPRYKVASDDLEREVERLTKQIESTKQRAADYKEFQRLAGLCMPDRVADAGGGTGTGWVYSLTLPSKGTDKPGRCMDSRGDWQVCTVEKSK